MAITIRTGANGSYKSSYVAYFVIFEALKAGRVVVTNIEGMTPLNLIEERFDIKFPSTAKLIRITSRDAKGLELWQHFFCWAPLGALLVIDECQDIYSRKIGFKMENVRYRPLSEFLPDLPKNYESFFHSRHVPANMDELDPCETDDRGVAEYDEDGRIIYPFTFNEGFMRHRKYNWDIELLSPDWSQIDSGIKACAEQCFYHKGRDAYFWSRRKPYIYKHGKNVTTPSVPKGKDPNITTQKIPLDAFLLYKSTATGEARQSGAMNMLARNPKIVLVLLLGILSIGYFFYGLSNLVFGSSEEVANAPAQQAHVANNGQKQTGKGAQADNDVSGRGDTGQAGSDDHSENGEVRYVDKIRQLLEIDDINKLYYMGHTTRKTDKDFQFFVSLEAISQSGTYYLTDRFLKLHDINFVHFDDCLLRLTKETVTLNVFCKPVNREELQAANSSPTDTPQISLF